MMLVPDVVDRRGAERFCNCGGVNCILVRQ
jgi:hypothetical protein